MNTLVLRLLINHLADIISALEEQMDKITVQVPHDIGFARIRKSPMSEEHTYKELLPLYGLMQTLEKSLPSGLDAAAPFAIEDE